LNGKLPFVDLLTAHRLLVAWALALLSAALLVMAGIRGDVEQRFQTFRAEILEKPASGDFLLVEIDAKSLQALDRWPWPRSHYAEAIDKLSGLGAEQIVFDIDFSAHSTTEQDQEFAEAIARSDASVVLPTFRQKDAADQSRYVESLPIEELRVHAFLASVNVHPDNNGQLNTYSYGTVTDATVRPSLASMLADSSGNIEKSFAIDQSIDPSTIPRLSFIDVLEGNVLPQSIEGKKILVGATAIELGDRYPISRFGVVPGVLIQALAAETMLQSTDMANLGKWPPLIAASAFLLILVLSGRCSHTMLTGAVWIIGLALFASILAFEKNGYLTYSNVPALFFLLIFLVLEKFSRTRLALNESQFYNETSKLPNETALQQWLRKNGGANIATLRISEFRDLLVVTDVESRIELFGNIAERLKFPAVDGCVYHLDSDIFSWIVKDEYRDDIAAHFDTAATLFHSPVIAGGSKVRLDVSFGISNESIDKSKIASEQAANAGKRWMWHDAAKASAVGEKQSLLVDLDQALANGDINIVYQPKWDLKEDRLSGAEALVRWNHAERGRISPDLFIPMLEKARRIDDITLFVLQSALLDLASWEDARPGLSCSVNISAQLLGDSMFVEKAIALVEGSKAPNQQVTFEVTETATLADPDLSIMALQRIRDAGIRVSIDDYGTGQSTMSYLQRLPADEIKIDQSFVKTIVTEKSNQVIVKSAIEMAHALGFKVVAEGIEDEHCLNLLTRMKCDIGQGWHISKPVTADIFRATWLETTVFQDRKSA
jgi:EAL domain-containing protein (putative c-di-GMP-specific phosphodiesterase class I)/CHASE2 domain-containing sensor protein